MNIANQRGQERRGLVLLAVLVVIVLLSLAAYQYSDLMLAEYKASHNAHRAAQVKSFADSGIHHVAALISNPDSLAALNGSIYDNPDAFEKVAVGGDGAKGLNGYFRIIAAPDPEDGDSTAYRSGVTDESGKINLNAFLKRDPTGQQLQDALMKLPNMTEELAASIVDWLDADSETRQNGAENDYYSAETPPYRCKNGPIDSVDELLYVKGMSIGILYGNDLNRNGFEDADEVPDAEGFNRGLAAYLTVYSRDVNSDPAGQAPTFVNEADLAVLYEKLSTTVDEDMTKFLIMYRQYGASNSTGQTQSLGQSIAALLGGGQNKNSKTPTPIAGVLANWTPDFNKKTATKVSSMFDLVNVQVSIPGKDSKSAATLYQSPLNDAAKRREVFPKLFEYVTIFEESDIPARVNVNTAPRAVLAALPDLTESDVDAIISLRPRLSSSDPPSAIYQTPAWLLTEANLKTDTLKKIEKTITTKTQVYHVQAVGTFDGPGPSARIEAVIDTNAGRPRLLMWRDLTELGAVKLAP